MSNNQNNGTKKGGTARLFLSNCFSFLGKRSRSLDPSRPLSSAILGRVPTNSEPLSHHKDGSVHLREAFVAYMGGLLSRDERDQIEAHLREPENVRDREHWDALFEQYEDELVEIAMAGEHGEALQLLPDRPDDLDIQRIRADINRERDTDSENDDHHTLTR